MGPLNNNRTNRYTLSVQPVNYSLTDGTNIPAPLDSPPRSPAGSARPPTPGGGPLTSHPTTPEDMPGAFPPTPDADVEHEEGLSKINASMFNTGKRTHSEGFRVPQSPASASAPAAATYTATTTSSPEPQRRPSAVRRLFSLSSLRGSFNNSRTSLNLSRPNEDTSPQAQRPANGVKRPSTASIMSEAPSIQTQTTEQPPPRPDLRRKKSSGWFNRRKSGMFMVNGDDTLAAVDETPQPPLMDSREAQRPDARESKRLKTPVQSAPLLPEVGQLGGGRLGDGDLGWDEDVFRR
ncbi:hypothetical protein LTR62_003977 [Meristemomyces frigidus]|uniref:Uncharacterized protein n=1 Tax=Meristemomyces frigidus TaxID=1508187 RepID=A0AAN7YKG8_9PEZI|nr:hypothetical protein LTR62_003977 [Meristemomyces frigidus]